MSKTTTTTESTEKTTWTTWEELLLTCAVKRHGPKDWDSVAMELQSRSSADESVVLSAQICRNKYRDLKRRFMDTDAVDDENDSRTGDEADDGDSIPWLEELRKLRVAELKQEVHRHDLSIQSLQLKVKSLEEDRERNENEDGEKPDLENDKKDSGDGTIPLAAAAVGKSDSYRSFNESNSTLNRESGGGGEKAVAEPVHTGTVKPVLEPTPVTGEDSCNDSSDTVAKHAAASKKKIEPDGSTELHDSAAESNGGTTTTRTKESSDVQSSASLTKKRRRGGGGDEQPPISGGGGEKPVVSPASTIKRESMGKSEPLVKFLDVIQSHKHGSMFKRRLESQKTEMYRNMIRQHVDLETVKIRIEDGSYSTSTAKFYMDLLLLFTNVITFFPKASSESAAAHELRHLVLNEIKHKRIGRHVTNVSAEAVEGTSAEAPPPALVVKPKREPEKSDSLLTKHKPSAPIVVSRKRSSITAKPSTSNKADKKTEKDKPPPVVKAEKPAAPAKSPVNDEESSKVKVKEKALTTGARSMRKGGSNANLGSRTTTTSSTPNSTNSNKNNPGSTNKLTGGGKSDSVPQKAETKKKPEVTTTVKKRGAADFLKRIKKNSPGKGGSTAGAAAVEEKKSSAVDGGGSGSRKREKKRTVDELKEGTSRLRSGQRQAPANDDSPTKRAVGRPPKKGKEAVLANRGRESGGGEAEVAAKRPKKRPRR